MITDVRTRLAELDNPKGCNACLGRTAILGKSGWFSQGKIQIVLGPLNRKQLRKFAPGTNQPDRAQRTGSPLSWDEKLNLSLSSEFVKKIYRIKPGMDKNNPPIIGWNTFLRSKPVMPANKTDTLEYSIFSQPFTISNRNFIRNRT